jgi:hypothetical protein
VIVVYWYVLVTSFLGGCALIIVDRPTLAWILYAQGKFLSFAFFTACVASSLAAIILHFAQLTVPKPNPDRMQIVRIRI